MNKKNIIIIGATSGIGRALFEKYAADGNRIGIVGRRTHLLDELMLDLRREHPDWPDRWVSGTPLNIC